MANGEPQWYYQWLFSPFGPCYKPPTREIISAIYDIPSFDPGYIFHASTSLTKSNDPPDMNEEFFLKWLEEDDATGTGKNKDIDLFPTKDKQPKKCTCPAINFYYNGIGCKCGGE